MNICKSDVGSVIFPDALKVDNKNIELYCVYDNKKSVLEEASKKYALAVDFVRKNYQIDELNESTWEKFRQSMRNVSIDYPDIDSKILYQIASLESVFDIYENDSVNDYIKELVSLRNTNIKLASEVSFDIDLETPHYSEKLVTNQKPSLKVGASLNVAAATNYANTYATSPNTSSYYYFNNGDCTNFMSQILEAAGVSQVVYDSEYSGWWHKTQQILFYTKHTHSRSWTMANTFANYMGVTVRTTNISTWANGLNQGDFVALDFTNDGSFDHMGYVTAKSSTNTAMVDDAVNGVCFNIPDVKIAQHTSNYNKWISDSGNNWETSYNSGAYGRIRG